MSSYLERRVLELEDRLQQLAQQFRALRDVVGKIRQDATMGGYPGGSGGGGGAGGLVPCVTTSATTAATGTSPNIVPGTVTVTLTNFDGTHLANTGGSVSCYVNYTTIIASGKNGWVETDDAGNYWFIVADC